VEMLVSHVIALIFFHHSYERTSIVTLFNLMSYKNYQTRFL